MNEYKINIPHILYKYRNFNEEAKIILSGGEIYFATTDRLNDPYEKFFRFKNGAWVNSKSNQLEYLSAKEYSQYFLDAIRSGKNEPYGILSLCDSNEEIRMYKEYSNDFKGFCIGFDWKGFELFFAGSYPPVKNMPRRVTYGPIIELEEAHVSPEKWLEIFAHKLPTYDYEKEWRIFYRKGIFANNAVRYAIKEIVFGHNMLIEHVDEIKKIIKDLKDVSLFKTNLVGDTLEIKSCNG